MKHPLLLQQLAYLLFILCVISCDSKQDPSQVKKGATEIPLAYARQFTIEDHTGYTLLQVLQPYPAATTPARYALIKKGATLPDNLKVDAIVEVPVKRLVVTSTSHIPALDMLKSSETLVGFPNTGLISSPIQQKRMAEKGLTDLGSGQLPNLEKLVALQPDLILAFAMQADDPTLEAMQRTGIPVLLNADFLENSPLGRAEWIKFMGELLGKRVEAKVVFERIAAVYDSLQQLTATATAKPSVFSGLMYGDTWYVPGGKSWAAQFITDAGGHYLWSETATTGSLTLSPEAVLAKAADAEIWLNAADFTSLEALGAADERYRLFTAWQSGEVYTYTAKQTPAGGNAYLEEGYARPDLVLTDLVKILHPELLPAEKDFTFYKKLH